MHFRKLTVAMFIAAFALLTSLGAATAQGGLGTPLTYTTGDCGATTFTAGNAQFSNMYLIISVDGETQSARISQSGTTSLTAGPFTTPSGESKTILYRIFGGPERSYDQPLWNGYGTASFNADIAAYAASVGGSYNWVISGPGDPNPFTTWASVTVESCYIPAEGGGASGGDAGPVTIDQDQDNDTEQESDQGNENDTEQDNDNSIETGAGTSAEQDVIGGDECAGAATDAAAVDCSATAGDASSGDASASADGNNQNAANTNDTTQGNNSAQDNDTAQSQTAGGTSTGGDGGTGGEGGDDNSVEFESLVAIIVAIIAAIIGGN